MKEQDLILSEEMKVALKQALDFEYRDIPTPQELKYDHQFSSEYRRNIRKAAKMTTRCYVAVGRYSLRRAVAVALIAAMVMAATLGAVAVSRILITWNETQNEEQGTLDVTFDVDVTDGQLPPFTFVKPPTPAGYEIAEELRVEDISYDIEYRGHKEESVYYSQLVAEGTGLGIDSDDRSFREITVNGYKGYTRTQDENCMIVWSDGVAIFELRGPAAAEDLLWQMAESVRQY